MRLIFDFDGTITEKDTISTFAKAGIAHQHARNGEDLSARWDDVVRKYVEDYRRYQELYPTDEADRRTLSDEIKFLAGAEEVEASSLLRVEQSGVFAGLTSSDLFRMGSEAVSSGRIVLRRGFKELLSAAEEKGWDVGVISVNWSCAFIQGVLDDPGFHVLANEISQGGMIKGPDCLGRPLTNCSGKLHVYRGEFKARNVAEVSGDSTPTVYFGDSTTDLECLANGTAGVSITSNDSNSTLVQTLRRLGFSVPHASKGGRGDNKERATICWARDFQEVLQSGFLEQFEK
ncbi:unnamed protein product [Clonostachys rosea]|uniref:Haloacid dehalogenase-like hydrolase n=1 Tax=Bionectria ochroleuca TaxID=29856 RepID=A0ABY6UUK9_BIOOC|nr:unnamed protein product [Clonostachys rosea]